MNKSILVFAGVIALMVSETTSAQERRFTPDDEVTSQCEENPDEISRLEKLREKMAQGIAPLLQKKDQNIRLNLTEAENLFQGEILVNNLEAQLITRRYQAFLCEELERLKKAPTDPNTIT